METPLLLQSELGIKGGGTDLLIKICEHSSADRLLIYPATAKYLDLAALGEHGIEPVTARLVPPVYPQLWGEFIYNLSALDMLMNCGPASRTIITGAENPRNVRPT